MFFNHLTKPIVGCARDRLRERKIMTDTSLVQGEFAPADTSFAADISVQSSPLDAVVSAVEADAAVTAEPNGFIELGLAPELVQAVADLGYTQPTSCLLYTSPSPRDS